MENTVVKIDPKEYGLDEIQVQTIESAFMPKIVERDGLKSIYEALLTKEITPDLCREAKVVRLKLVKVRTGIADIHKTQKAFFLAAGRFVDAWKNKETLPVEQMETKLAEIEEYYERIEKARIAELQIVRATEIASYQEFGSFVPGNLGELTDDVYANYLLGVKTAFETKKEQERKAKEDEEARIKAEKAEQERIRVENENLKKEAEKREAELAKERAKAEQERKDREAKEAAERAERDAKEKAEREAHEKALAAEREKAAEAQRQLEAKAEQERKSAQEAAEKAEAELAKGDVDKLRDLITDLQTLKSKYQFKAKKNQARFAGVCTLLDKVVGYIQEGAK